MKKIIAISIIGIMCVLNVLAESTFSFRVNTDRNGTIQNAFTTALSATGLKNVSNNSDYLLNVNIIITPLAMSNNPSMEYIRLELNADLLDKNGNILLPYSFSIRQGHINHTTAEERAFRDAVLKINAEYRNLLNDIIASVDAQPVKQGSTIGIRINTDRDGIIQNVFTTIYSDAGFKNDNNNFDYLLNVNITLTPLSLVNNQNKFVRIELIANLLDNNGRVVLPYTINWREGHVNETIAEDRVFREAARKINIEYRNLLNDLISK
ncbi:MAG: hypothetical protein FWB86_08140 [Treponema sp.]|nr:hypothetical protein [Treponema sp.]MCL2251953.1 hypothetical protein [Treponema sp.]